MGFPAFLHRYFPPQSPPSHPLDAPLCSQQEPSSWDCSTVSKLQLPAAAPSRGSAKDCLILFPFRLPQISCFILSLKCFSYYSDTCPKVGIGPLLQFPHTSRAVLLTLLFFPLVPLSYQVLHGSVYSFPLVRNSCLLSAGGSARTSVSEGVFLMYPWREMCAMSPSPSAVFSPIPY